MRLPAGLTYLLGLILLVLILLLDFTGYVLRWDEGIRWALVVGTNLLKTIPGIGEGLYRFVIGGSEPGAPTLIRFYAWHIFGLTLAVAGITAWHIFRVRRDGGISAPPPERGKKTNRIPRSELLRKEIIAMIIAGVVVLLLSVLIPAPIDQPLVENGALVGDSRCSLVFPLDPGNPAIGRSIFVGSSTASRSSDPVGVAALYSCPMPKKRSGALAAFWKSPGADSRDNHHRHHIFVNSIGMAEVNNE